MKKCSFLMLSLVLIGGLTGMPGCSNQPPDIPGPDPKEEFSGGQNGTHFTFTEKAFDKSAPGLTSEEFDRFQVGNSFFRSSWVAAPSSTSARDGLGPLFNSISCTGCHIRDGRGAPPEVSGDPLVSMLARLSIPGQAVNGGPLADPTYGGQLQNRSIAGHDGEGELLITYEEVAGEYADGTPYSLRQPTYDLVNPAFGAFRPDLMISPRVAPAMVGLGLLEAIPEAELLLLADEQDVDGDGISGRPNWVFNAETGTASIGRFGWKANQPSLRQQNAGAFNGDLGLTTSLFPEPNCAPNQDLCQQAATGGEPEVTDEMLVFVTAYVQSLGVPARRGFDEESVLNGQQLFSQIGCTACHVPSYTTASDYVVASLAGQTIYPYTDLLLHDMGEGLADGRPDFLATGTEWRTPPLWGLGLIRTVNGHSYLLHDGRARSIEEAILWHGGEAQAANDRFQALTQQERNDILTFLNSL